MKKLPRLAFQDLETDLQVFGFDWDEYRRAERFRQNNPEVRLWTPLINDWWTKADCLARLTAEGIEIPLLYRLGYRNNNCIGCVKGQMGYWNKIRRDFPEVFARMSRLEQEIGAALCKSYAGDGKRKRIFLADLDPDAGRYESEESIACGFSCGVQE